MVNFIPVRLAAGLLQLVVGIWLFTLAGFALEPVAVLVSALVILSRAFWRAKQPDRARAHERIVDALSWTALLTMLSLFGLRVGVAFSSPGAQVPGLIGMASYLSYWLTIGIQAFLVMAFAASLLLIAFDVSR